MIEINNVTKVYEMGEIEVHALRGVSLQIEEGDFLTIMGPSGAGKSTLLSILGMLDADWRGEYFLDGHAVHAMRPKARIARAS